MLTDAELILLTELLKVEAIEKRRNNLKVIDENTPKNYAFVYNSLTNQKYDNEQLIEGYKGVILEGSARSRKTFSVVDFIIYIGLYIDRTTVVTIIKETYVEFKTTLYNEFRTALNEFGLDNPFERLQEVGSFKIGKCRVTFVGADQPKKFDGLTSDLVYFNELLPISELIFRKAIMRCSWGWIADYNPSLTQHYVYDRVITRPDVGFLRTTFRDNPHVPIGQKNEILAYEPWLQDSYEIDIEQGEIMYNNRPIDEKNQPPPHPVNVPAGTADEFMWKVYGLGLRGAMKGTIFKNVSYIDEFPDLAFSYGLDFGFTVDPCTLTKCAEDENTIYIELLSYTPMETPEEIFNFCKSIDFDWSVTVTADSSDKYTSERKGAIEMVSSLRSMGMNIYKVSKTKSVMFWLTSMRKKKIVFINNNLVKFAKIEAQNYIMQEIHGIEVNQPVDKFNHIFDSSRYRHMALNSKTIFETKKSLSDMGFNY